MPPLALRPPPRILHIPLSHTHFDTASKLQSALVARFLRSKPPHSEPPPPATIITSEFTHHVYTLGRRDQNSQSSIAELQHPNATVVPTLRGGQTTYHGPGQLTAYAILDLAAVGLSSRCWIAGLEEAVIGTLGVYGLKGRREKEFPGVWIAERKVCAVGVHMKRHITSFGIGLNVCTGLAWFEKITACGIDGSLTTSMAKELGREVDGGVEGTAGRFVEMMRRGLGAEMVEVGRPEDWIPRSE